MTWRLNTALTCVAIMGLLTASTARRVAGEEMAPSLAEGDLVWILPGLTVRRGDVVLLRDPLDPERRILRRAVAPGGTEVRFDDGGIRVGTKRIRQQDMGEADGYSVLKETIWSKPPAESTDWLIRKRKGANAAWNADAVSVPDGHWYLVADDRDNAIDSRWWGPVPEAYIDGVVRIRWGQPDQWRSRIAWIVGTDDT